MKTLAITEEQKTKHIDFLREKVFQTQTKWPHFERLLEEFAELGNSVKSTDNVTILERAYVYGGDSLFAPLFKPCNLTLIDCQTLTAGERGAYQGSWTQDPRCLHITSDLREPITQTSLANDSQDLILIPNVVHHVKDQDAMFLEFARILKPGGKGYIFEALLRELHQAPDDYVRYTPWGFDYMLEKSGLKLTKFTPIGGPFEAIAYCWVQAVQYFPENEQKELKEWFWNKHFKELIDLDKKYPQNLSRKYTSFPLGYGIFFEKI